MAHIVNPYNLDDDDDAVFSALLSQGLIWVEDDDNDSHESEIEEMGSSNEIIVRTLSGHTGSVQWVAVSGDFAVSASSDKTLRVWNWKTGQHLRTLSGHTGSVQWVAVSGDFAVSASLDKTLRVWNWKSGKHIRTLTDFTQELSAIALDGDVVFAVSLGEVWIWNWQTAEHLQKLTGWHGSPVMTVGVDGDLVLSASSDLLLVRNWKTREILHKLRIDWDCEDLVVYKEFAVSINYDSVDVWNWKTNEELKKSDLRRKKNNKIDKKVFLTPYNVCVYSRETNKWYLYNLNSETSYTDAVAFVEDYSHIIRGSDVGRISVIRIDSSLQRLIAGKTANLIASPSREVEASDDIADDNELPDTPKPKNKHSHSRNTQRKREMTAKAIHDYSTDEVLQVARDYIHERDEEWVNFSRVSQHLYETFYNLEPKRLGQPNKKYKTLLKFFADFPSNFDLRQDDAKNGLYWIRLKRTH